MRRKIEKYLAKKLGIDETSIELTEDGRFDFQGDMEGVLNAVRGRDCTGKQKKPDRNRSSNRKSTAKKPIKDLHNPTGPMPMPISYLPYGMAPLPYPGMHHMYPHEMPYGHPGAEVMMPYLPPPYVHPPPHGAKTNPPPRFKHMPSAAQTLAPTGERGESSKPDSTNKDNGIPQCKKTSPGPVKPEPRSSPSSAFLSAEKTSPKPASSLLRRLNSPCEEMNIHGMTPLSNLRGTFESFYGSGAENNFSEFSPEDNICLNKALFADDPDARKGTMSPKTPMMKFAIGLIEAGIVLNASCIKNMQVNRVSISPVATKGSRSTGETTDKAQKSAIKEAKAPGTVSRSIHFADEDATPGSITKSALKLYKFMPSDTYAYNGKTNTTPFKSQTPMNVSQSSGISKNCSEHSPFAASLTPIGYDWGRQLGFSPDNTTVGSSFTPFRSPSASFEMDFSVKTSSRKGDRNPLSVLPIKPASLKLSTPKRSVAKRPNKQDIRPSPSKRQRTDVEPPEKRVMDQQEETEKNIAVLSIESKVPIEASKKGSA
jgi:hypothetical protein